MLELVGPELQSLYDDRQIEVSWKYFLCYLFFANNFLYYKIYCIFQIELVDMHFGTGSSKEQAIERDPYLVNDYLKEIKTCHRLSKSIFFIVSINIIFEKKNYFERHRKCQNFTQK